MAGFLKSLIFPAKDAGVSETFRNHDPTATSTNRSNEQSPLISETGSNNYNDSKHSQQEHSDNHSHNHEHSSKEEFRHDNHINNMNANNAHNSSQSQSQNQNKNNPKNNQRVLRKLRMATALCFTFMTVEVIGGILAGSLAILSDAAHLMADLASFAVAIVAAHLAARPSTTSHTYGLKRVESLAALFSMSSLAIVSIGLAVEAVRRIYKLLVVSAEAEAEDDVEEVDGKLMSIIATIGVLVNIALAAVLGENHVHMPGGESHDHEHEHEHEHSHNGHDDDTDDDYPPTGVTDMQRTKSGDSEHLHSNEVPLPKQSKQQQQQQRNVNLHAAYLHVMADLAQSGAVLIAGLIIWAFPEWQIVDPIATILFCIMVFYSTLGVIRSAVCVLLEEVPPQISWQDIHTSIQNIPGVVDVHDLHIWSISHGISAMTVHVHTQDTMVDINSVIRKIAQIGKTNGIQHSTAQVQPYASSGGSNHENGCITCVYTHESQACVSAP